MRSLPLDEQPAPILRKELVELVLHLCGEMKAAGFELGICVQCLKPTKRLL